MTQRTTACQSPPTSTVSWSLLKFVVIESVMLSNHLILCHPLLLLPSIFPGIRVFPNVSTLCIICLKYWSFSFSISPSNKYSGWISFRIDCFDLLAVQGNLKSLLQYHSSKTSILWCSAFFMVHLSHPYITTVFCCWYCNKHHALSGLKLHRSIPFWFSRLEVLCGSHLAKFKVNTEDCVPFCRL